MHTDYVKLGEDGRIVIPAAARRELGLVPGQTLVLESDGDTLLIRSGDAVLRDTQDYFRRFAAPGVSVVDDLIAERRFDAAREESEAGAAPRGAGE